MDSKITINIVEPGSSTPVDPVVPNTGLFTHGIGGPEATIIAVSTILALALVAAIVWYYKKHTNIHLSNITKHIKSKKSIAIGLTALAILVSAGTFAALLVNAGKSNTNAAEGEDEAIAPVVSSDELTIELGNEPVFAVAKTEVTVEKATDAGYTLTAFAESTDLVSTTDESNTIPMIAVDEGELAALTDNTYGLALAGPASQTEEVYTTISTDADNPTLLAEKEEATKADDTTTIYYGFYITPDVPYGTYTGNDIYYDVEENYITNLSFNGNDSDGGTAMEGMTLLAGDTITLPEKTYTRAGYEFAGWNTAADGTGKAYADEAEFTASLDKTEDVTLYAQWALPVIGDLTEMQDFAKLTEAGKASVLKSMTPGQQYQLQDNRDQTLYYIAKLADGHVWMTQNLDLDLSTTKELTPENTNIKANWTPENSTLAIQGTSVSGWESSNTEPYSADPGDVYYYTTGNNTKEEAIDKETCERDHEDGSCPHYHAGNYYNWSAAVASNDTASITEQYANVETSICPAGWRLPMNRNAESPIEGNEQITQISSYDGILGEYSPGPRVYKYLDGGFNAIRTNPLWLARSGGIYDVSLYGTGSSGYYWSSTVSGSVGAYPLSFGSSDVFPASNQNRSLGCSVRCIAQ